MSRNQHPQDPEFYIPLVSRDYSCTELSPDDISTEIIASLEWLDVEPAHNAEANALSPFDFIQFSHLSLELALNETSSTETLIDNSHSEISDLAA